MTRWTLGICILVASAACGDVAEADRWAGVMDTVGGVPVARNPAGPIYGPDRVVLDTVWSAAGPAETDTAPLWEQPRAMALMGGAVYVLDPPAHHVHRLSGATGEWLGTFGRMGAGPGELLRPVDVEPWRGSVGVLDAGHLGIVQFSGDGEYEALRRFSAIVFTFAPIGDTTALVTSMGLPSPHGLLRGDSVTPFEPAPALAGKDALLDECQRFGGMPGRIVSFSCVVPHIRIHDPSGAVLREVALEVEATPRPQEEIDAYIERLGRVVAGTVMSSEEVKGFLAEKRQDQRYRRAMRAVRYDEANDRLVLWEQEEEDFGAGPATFHVFTSDGVYLARFGLNASIWDFGLMDGDLVALVRNPDTELVEAVRYQVRLPGTPDRRRDDP